MEKRIVDVRVCVFVSKVTGHCKLSKGVGAVEFMMLGSPVSAAALKEEGITGVHSGSTHSFSETLLLM